MLASAIIMVGVLSHKGSAAFALMVSIHTAGIAARRQKIMLALFASMTPVGVLIGLMAAIVLGENETVTAWIEGSFNALAAGTFIYVAIIEMIDAELARRDVRVAKFMMSVITGKDDVPMPTEDADRVAKFVLIMVGVALIAVLVQWTHTPH